MSRLNPDNQVQNPCNLWLTWKGDVGGLRYYDKEKEENVDFDNPCTFIWLDQLYGVTGWHEPSESGIYSNEVYRLEREEIHVRSFEGVDIARGIYSEIRDKIKSAGARFMANNYVAVKVDGKLTLASIKLRGAAFAEWNDFFKANRKQITQQAVVMSVGETKKKGGTKYVVPSFSLREISEETNAEALELNKTLDEYLKSYVKKPNDTPDNTPEHLVEHPDVEMRAENVPPVPVDEEDDLPF